MAWKGITTYFLRATQSVFSVIILGLACGILAKLGTNDSRVTFALVTALLNLIYFGYSQILMPSVFDNVTFSSIIFGCETILMIFYLAAMGSIADVFPSGSCDNFFSDDISSACKMYKALLPFTLFQWFLFIATFVLFIGFSYAPEIRTHGFGHTFKLSKFEYGAIFSSFNTLFWKKIPDAKTETEGDAAAGPVEGTAAATDAEATVGIASTDEDQEKDASPDAAPEGQANEADVSAPKP